MKILYVHGFGSHYDPTHEKVVQLEQLGEVYGVTIDYCKGFTRSYNTVVDAVNQYKVDLIVGTSVGGLIANQISVDTGIDYIALNPIVQPSVSMPVWEGDFCDTQGQSKYLSETAIISYPDFKITDNGLIIVETNDEIVDTYKTLELFENDMPVKMINGGFHRVMHMSSVVTLIKEYLKERNA